MYGDCTLQYGFELEDSETLSKSEFCYDRVAEGRSSDSGRDVNEALDVVITGEVSDRLSKSPKKR